MASNGVTTDSNGKFVLEELSMDDLNELLAGGRNRGIYADIIDQVVKADKLAVVVSTHPALKGKDAASILNSINGNITRLSAKKGWPELKAMKRKMGDEDAVVLYNVSKHSAA